MVNGGDTSSGFGGGSGGGGGGVGGGRASGFSHQRMCVLVPVGFQGGQQVFGGQMMQPLMMQDPMYPHHNGSMLPMLSMPFQTQGAPQGMFPPRMIAQSFPPSFHHGPAHDQGLAAGMAAHCFNMARNQPQVLQLPPSSPLPQLRSLSAEVTAGETENSLFAMFSFKVAPCEKQFVHDW
jgi:hypothetical protein